MSGDDLALTKHHGSGNDFLVFVDLEGIRPLKGAEVRALCDRHRGIGADGVIRLLSGAGGTQISMELTNADGSPAEMSGNGIRCLVQAAVEAGLVSPGRVAVGTGAGVKQVDYESLSSGLGRGCVEMGSALVGAALDWALAPGAERAVTVDMGNPHLVLLFAEAVGDDTVTTTGARLERSVEGGTNVEFAWLEGASVVGSRVFERGVGETLACGTGACAIAAATRSWGLTGDRVRVEMPGGPLDVRLTPEAVFLTGPVRKVADVTVRGTDLADLVAEYPYEARAESRPAGSTEEAVAQR